MIKIKKAKSGEYYIKNENGLKLLKALNNDIELGINSTILSFLFSITNILISTFWVLNSYQDTLMKVQSFLSFFRIAYWLSLFFLVISVCVNIYVVSIFSRCDNMNNWISSMELKGYFNLGMHDQYKESIHQIISKKLNNYKLVIIIFLNRYIKKNDHR